MIRDEELQRLIRYAQGMGLSVRFKPYVKGSDVGGGWTTDGSEITVYESPRDTKISKILILIHEIGHHKGFIENNRKVNPDVLEALEDEDPKKSARRKIYRDEVRDTQYWEQIYKDTNCQFPIEKLYASRDFDIWWYEQFYEREEPPTLKEKTQKYRELKEKYRKKK